MKKTLVALAVAGAFAAPAFADVTISGAINIGPMFTKDGDGSTSVGNNNIFSPGCSGTCSPGNGQGFSQNNLANNYSHIDVESVDDIGNGNQVVFHGQMQFNTGALDNTPVNRNSFLGVRGSWGGIYWGTNEGIYEQYMYEADPLDGAVGLGGNLSLLGTPGVARVFEVGQSAPGVDFYRRQDNAIWFRSANYGGFSFGVDYTLNAHRNSIFGVQEKPTIFALGVQYKPDGGPFYVNAAYEHHKDLFGVDVISGGTSFTSTKDTGLQIGGGVMFGDLGLHLRYEKLKYEGENGGTTGDLKKYERDAVWIAAKLNLASGYVGAELGHAMEGSCDFVGGAACNADETAATLLGIGYFHNLSKQTQAQFIFANISNGDAANYVFAGGPATANNVNGAKHTGIYVSLKHVF